MKLPTLALLLATARAADVPPIEKVESSESPLPETAGDVQAPLIRKAKSSKIPMAKSSKIPMAKSAKKPEQPDDPDAPSLELPALAPYDFEAARSERRLGANDAICGDDNLRRANYKAVGRFYHGHDQACRCTAFLISEDVFLTSSACYLHGRLVEGCPVDDESEVRFEFGSRDRDVKRHFSVDVDSFKSYPRDSQGQAWAVGRLHKNIWTGKTAGATVGNWFKLGYVPPEEDETPISVVSYSYGSRQQKGVGNMGDEVKKGLYQVYFKADAGNYPGGPVIDTTEDYPYTSNYNNRQKVIGIYTSGNCDSDYNYATPIDSNDLRDHLRTLGL